MNAKPGLLFACHLKSLSPWLCVMEEWEFRWADVKLWKFNYDQTCLKLSKEASIHFFPSPVLLRYLSCSAPAEIFLCSCDPLPSISLPLSSFPLYLSLHLLPMLWCNMPHWRSESERMTERVSKREKKTDQKIMERKWFFFKLGCPYS